MKELKKIKRGSATNLLEYVLINWDVEDLNQVNQWYKDEYANKFKLHSSKIRKINELLAAHEEVWVMGDYDGDGVTSCSIMKEGLEYLGHKVTIQIPKRFSEGFGVNYRMIDAAPTSALIVTVDNGIAQVDVINYAKQKGYDVIVTDHHLPASDEYGNIIYPEADVIIDPQAIPSDSPFFTERCGAGICYQLMKDLLLLKNKAEKDILDRLLCFAAVGTVTDCMPIRSVNYFYVRQGLALLKSEKCPLGLKSLLNQLEIPELTSKDIAFSIGPIINAASRMQDDGAYESFNLLTAKHEVDAAIWSEDMIKSNTVRKSFQDQAFQEAEKIIEANGVTTPLVVYIPKNHEGIIGIVAGKLAEKYNVPCIVVTEAEIDGAMLLKGSGRTNGNYHLKNELDKCQDLLYKYGGHAAACGLSLLPENLDALRETLVKNCKDFIHEENDTLQYDLEITADEVVNTLLDMAKYEPFGESNPYPIFKITNFVPVEVKMLGEKKNHVKLTTATELSAIGFDMASQLPSLDGCAIDLFGTIGWNYYRGNKTPQIQIISF